MNLPPPRYHTHGWHAALLARGVALSPASTAVIHLCDPTAPGAAVDAAVQGLITPIRVGPEAGIRATADAGDRTSPHTGSGTSHTATSRLTPRRPCSVRRGVDTDEGFAAHWRVHACDDGGRSRPADQAPGRPRLRDGCAALFSGRPDQRRSVIGRQVPHRPERQRLGACARSCPATSAVLAPVGLVNTKLPSALDAIAPCKTADQGQIIGFLLEGMPVCDDATGPEAAGWAATRIASFAVAVPMLHATQAAATPTQTDRPTGADAIFDAVKSRTSARVYRDRPVPRRTVGRILQVAARAPSGNDTRPPQVTC